MSIEVSRWFEIERDDCPNQASWEFVTALCTHAADWIAFGVSPEDGFFQSDDKMITLGIAVSDQGRRSIIRDVRIDFYGSKVVMGDDETHQYVTPLDLKTKGVVEYKQEGASPSVYAEIAAKWLAVELGRTIERHEWQTLFYRHTRWVMADTGTCIVWSDTRNQRRSDLGCPTRIDVVHPRRGQNESLAS